MRILVVKPTALGDVAQALCVAPILKQWPGKSVHLTWLVDEDYALLVELCPWVDEIIRFPRRRFKQSGGMFGWLRSLRRQFEFDLVLDLQGLARSALMTKAVKAPRRVGLKSGRELSTLAYNELVEDSAVHAVDRYLAAAYYVVGNGGDSASLPATSLRKAEGLLPAGLQEGNYTVLHPYSLWKTKLWPWRKYEELANLLPEEKFVVVGQGDFFPIMATNVTDLRGQTDLRQLLLLLGNAKAVISTDSGPIHLAAAMDKPLVALFGATDPNKTAPRATKVQVVTMDLPCRPCLKRACKNPMNMACLQSIAAEKITSAWRLLTS